MTKLFDFKKQYESIGFVYPTYFWGLPKIVIEFIENMNFENNKEAYFYAVATYGDPTFTAVCHNSVYQLYELLHKRHNIKLNYGQKLKMVQNYVIMYDMNQNINEVTKKSNKIFIPIINSIKIKKNNRINKFTKIFEFINRDFIKKVSSMDKDYTVNNDCTGCTICEKVCPVINIEIVNNRPKYKHHCENCTACIQFCPKKAINYKNVTQNRRRYTNPEIDYMKLLEHNK